MKNESWRRYDSARQRWVLTLHIQPSARKNAVVGPHGDALKVKIAAPAVDNKANAELIRYLSVALDVARSSVLIRRGITGRHKMIEVVGGTELAARLEGLVESAARP